MSITIRKANINDAPSLSGLFLELVGTESNIEEMQRQIEMISNQSNYFVAVACLDGHIVGTAMGIVCHDLVGDCVPFLLIENVVVAKKSQGHGIGRMLMQSLEEFASANRCSYTILASSDEREQAHRFYESIGYSGVKRGFIKLLDSHQ